MSAISSKAGSTAIRFTTNLLFFINQPEFRYDAKNIKNQSKRKVKRPPSGLIFVCLPGKSKTRFRGR